LSVCHASTDCVYAIFGVFGDLSPVTLVLIHAFVTSRVDYCNALVTGAPIVTIDKLQRVLNAAARVVSDTNKFGRGLSTAVFYAVDHFINKQHLQLQKETVVFADTVYMIHGDFRGVHPERVARVR